MISVLGSVLFTLNMLTNGSIIIAHAQISSSMLMIPRFFVHKPWRNWPIWQNTLMPWRHKNLNDPKVSASECKPNKLPSFDQSPWKRNWLVNRYVDGTLNPCCCFFCQGLPFKSQNKFLEVSFFFISKLLLKLYKYCAGMINCC